MTPPAKDCTMQPTVEAMRVRCRYHDEQLSDHEKRIRAMEKATWKMSAIVGLAAAVLSFLGAMMGSG